MFGTRFITSKTENKATPFYANEFDDVINARKFVQIFVRTQTKRKSIKFLINSFENYAVFPRPNWIQDQNKEEEIFQRLLIGVQHLHYLNIGKILIILVFGLIFSVILIDYF